MQAAQIEELLRRRRRPMGRIWLAASLLALNTFALLSLCGVYVLGLDRAFGFDLSTIRTEPSIAFFLREPVLPWIVAPLSVLSIVAFWLCTELRRLGFVLAVMAAWLAVSVAAAANGVSANVVLGPVVASILLISGRSAFDP